MSWPGREFRFSVPFVRGKQRPRYYRGRVYTPAETKRAEAQIADAYRAVCGGAPPVPRWVPVRIELTVSKRLPKSAPRGVAAQVDLTKPDLDNVTKLVKDALNGVAWEDDSQVVEEHAARRWRTRRETDELEVTVTVPERWDPLWNVLKSENDEEE